MWQLPHQHHKYQYSTILVFFYLGLNWWISQEIPETWRNAWIVNTCGDTTCRIPTCIDIRININPIEINYKWSRFITEILVHSENKLSGTTCSDLSEKPLLLPAVCCQSGTLIIAYSNMLIYNIMRNLFANLAACLTAVRDWCPHLLTGRLKFWCLIFFIDFLSRLNFISYKKQKLTLFNSFGRPFR